MTQGPQSRKWQLTINNPAEHELDREKIKRLLEEFGSISYYCIADELGEKETPHTHIYMACSAPVRFSTLKKKFPAAHIEKAKGTSMENRDYIAKSGKWENDVKHGTSIPDSFEEWGILPIEEQGKRNDLALLRDLIQEGYTNNEIIDEFPQFLFRLREIEYVRQTILHRKYGQSFRELEVTYIWGPTATGKTRYVMEKYGYDKVYRVTDYAHPFDSYDGQDILLFDEFRSNLKIGDMLHYLDGYPITLPCRYSNRMANYTKVYIISNIDFFKQYPNAQEEDPLTMRALQRRIKRYLHFPSPDERHEYMMEGNRLVRVYYWDMKEMPSVLL